jgi:hypothetical protein
MDLIKHSGKFLYNYENNQKLFISYVIYASENISFFESFSNWMPSKLFICILIALKNVNSKFRLHSIGIMRSIQKSYLYMYFVIFFRQDNSTLNFCQNRSIFVFVRIDSYIITKNKKYILNTLMLELMKTQKSGISTLFRIYFNIAVVVY